MTIFKFNGDHAIDEVLLVAERRRWRYSRRHRRVSKVMQLVIRGTIKRGGASAAAWATTLNTMHGTQYQGAVSAKVGLYEDDGTTETAHILDGTDPLCMDGVKCLRFDWVYRRPGAEHATLRTFEAVLEAEIEDSESQILAFQETLQFVGTAGIGYEYGEGFFGAPQRWVRNQQTAQIIFQFGFAIGLSGYPELVVPDPILPNRLYPRRWAVTKGSARESRRLRLTEYPMSWRYVMNSTVDLSTTLIPVSF